MIVGGTIMSSRTRASSKSPSQKHRKSSSHKSSLKVDESNVVQETLFSSSSISDNAKYFLCLRLVFAAFVFLFWILRYGNFLYMSQQYDLFLWRSDYFFAALERPAGLSRYLSSFVLQFFHFPVVGALILSAFAFFSQWTTEKVFNLSNRLFPLSFIPPCLSILSVVNVNYFLFERIDVAYLYSFLFNFCWVLFFVFIVERQKNAFKRTGRFVWTYFIFYPVFGFFAILGAFIVILKEAFPSPSESNALNASNVDGDLLVEKKGGEVNTKSTKQKLRQRCELMALYSLVVPAIFWLCYSNSTPNFQYMYSAGLWEESTLTESREMITSNLISPFVTLMKGSLIHRETATNALLSLYTSLEIIFYVFIALLCALRNSRSIRRKKTATKAGTNNKSFHFVGIYSSLFLIVVMCVGTILGSYSSPNYQTLLRVLRLIDKEDWEKIITEESKIKDPVNPLISARGLAQFKTDRICNELFQRTLRPTFSVSLNVIETANMGGDRILLEYGVTKIAERVATNNFVTKRERSAWALKTLTLCAVLDENYELAQRYLYKFQGTIFYKRFTNELLDYIQWKSSKGSVFDSYVHPLGNTSQSRLEIMDKQFQCIRDDRPKGDSLSSGRVLDRMLYRILQAEDVESCDLETREKYLTLILASRNFPHFGKLLDNYLKLKKDDEIPRYIQEAIVFREFSPQFFEESIVDSKNTTSRPAWTRPDSVRIDPQVERRFESFTSDLRGLSKNPGLSNEALSKEIESKYGDTFWFYFGSETNIVNY